MKSNEKKMNKTKSFLNMDTIPTLDKSEDPYIGIMNHLDIDKLLKDKNQKVISINATKILSSGEDPFKEIMSKMNALQRNEILQVIAPFEPAPLITISKNKGYKAFVKSSPTRVDTYFVKDIDSEIVSNSETHYFAIDPNDLEQRKKLFGDKVKEINVCNLEMPESMVHIHNKISALLSDEALYVYHRIIPKALISEIQQSGYTVFLSKVAESDIRVLIFK